MKLYLSKNHSDEDGPLAEEGKLAIINCKKKDIQKLAEFLNTVNSYLEKHEYCHMQFRDSFKEWNENDHIDLEINVDER